MQEAKQHSRVVILGGGHAGVLMVEALRKKSKARVDITLIDRRNYHENNTAAVRYLVDPEVFDRMAVRLDDLYPLSQIKLDLVIGEVITVTPDNRVIVSIEREGADRIEREIPFDFLIVATGMVYPIFKGIARNLDARRRELTSWSQQITQAGRILLVGGGAVCVETAGEILERYPDKKLTIVHSGPMLLDSNKKSTRVKAMKYLRSKGADILLDQKVDFVARYELNNTGLPQIVQTSKGQLIETDLILATSGYALPNTEFLREHHPNVLGLSGQVQVLPTLQVRGGPSNIFAIGDVSEIPRAAKLYANIPKQVNVVMANIIALSKRRPPTKLPAKYKEGYSIEPVISVGRNFGIYTNPWGIGWSITGKSIGKLKTWLFFKANPKVKNDVKV